MNKYICKNKNCKQPFYRYKSTVRNPDRVFCSKLCQAEYYKYSKMYAGENNPNYKDGKYLDAFCECGNKKDHRSKKCSKCAKTSYPIGKKGEYLCNESIIASIIDSRSIKEAAKKINCARITLSKYIIFNKINIDHFVPSNIRPGKPKDILIKSNKRRNQTVVSCLLRNDLLEYICSECGLFPIWERWDLRLQLHHINGDGCDNRIENLTFLCPNCHTQTRNYTGKNKKARRKKMKEGSR